MSANDSQKPSLFLPSNEGSQFQDMLSQSSAPNWAKVSKESGMSAPNLNAKNLMSEINHILSDVRRDATIAPSFDPQAGGAKKTKAKAKGKSNDVKKMKRPSSKKTKSKTKSKSKITKPSKKSSKKSSKNSSKGKKQKGGEVKKKKVNAWFQNMRKIADFIKTEIPDLKDGIQMTSTAGSLLKKYGGVDEAISEIKKNKSAVTKLYKDIAKEQKETREKNKALKAKAKAGTSDSQ